MEYQRITERVKNASSASDKYSGELVQYKYGKDKTLAECLVDILGRLADLEDKIENKKLVFVPEYVEKYAIVKYTFWKNQPLDIATYYPCGIKMNGEIDYGFSGVKSGYITVVQDGFPTRAEAEAKLKELKNK